jgi:hypothetical protein
MSSGCAADMIFGIHAGAAVVRRDARRRSSGEDKIGLHRAPLGRSPYGAIDDGPYMTHS